MDEELFRVYMTQGQGECLVGEYTSREEAERVLEEGIARKDGSYRYVKVEQYNGRL